MLESFKEIEWGDYIEIMTYGNPPVYIQLLILVGLTLAYLIWRIVTKKRPMTRGNQLKNKILFILAFFLILFQEAYDLRGMLDSIGL